MSGKTKSESRGTSDGEALGGSFPVKQLVSQLPRGHVVGLLQASSASAPCTNHQVQIDNRAHKRHGKAISNFKATLPPADSESVQRLVAQVPWSSAALRSKGPTTETRSARCRPLK